MKVKFGTMKLKGQKVAKVAMIVSNPCLGDARVLKMVDAVKDMGHTVHVFATLGQGAKPYEEKEGVYFHRLQWSPGYLMRQKWYFKILFAFLPFRKVQGFVLSYISKWQKFRLFKELMFDKIVSIKPDLVHAHDLVCLQAGEAVAKACGAKLIYDAHELEVHRNPPLPFYLKWYVGYVERKYSRYATDVIIPGVYSSRVLAKSIQRKDIKIIYNSPRRDPSITTIREDLGLDQSARLLLYVGKITSGRGVGDILRILPMLPGVFFAAVGPSDPRILRILMRMARRLGLLNRFRVLPPVPYDQVVSYIQGANLGLLSVEPVTLSYRYCMPNKLFEMTFANVPILANELDEVVDFISEIGNGVITDFLEIQTLPYEIFHLMNSTQMYQHSNQTLELLEEKYSWNAQVKKLNSIYENAFSGGDV